MTDAPNTSESTYVLRPAGEFPLTTLAETFTSAYTDYFFPVHVDADMLSWIICTQTLDLASSRMILHEGEPVGFIFVSSRGLSQRIAAMGVLPQHRDKGLGRRSLEDVVEIAKARGYRRVVLEVIHENATALALYRKMGFRVTRSLIGYERPALVEGAWSADNLREVDPREVAKAIVHEGEPDLPWQREADSFFTSQPPSRAYTISTSAYAIVSRVTDTSVYLDAILVPRAKRRQGWGRRMMQALYAAYPGRAWTIAPTVPEDLAPEFFRAVGFKPGLIRQYEMVLDLRAKNGKG